MKNPIGLDKDYSAKMAVKLNELLSNVQILYMNVRSYHWNIVGKHFFKLHDKFEELYDELNDNADEIAERILMLGETPVHAFSEYLKIAELKESKNINTDVATVNETINGLLVLLNHERAIIELAGENVTMKEL